MACHEASALLLGVSKPYGWRWVVLLAFCTFSLSSALMWVTFAPCLYVFTDYFFGKSDTVTVNAIHSLSTVYMLLYPLVVHFTFPVFEYRHGGLRRGILVGALLNMAGGTIRYLGAFPSVAGFAVLFAGQTLAALGQVFMLAVPPQLAVVWFPDNEINLATALAVSANNIGIALGCLWSPWAIHASTMEKDIPRLLGHQAFLTFMVFVFIWFAFQRPPPHVHEAPWSGTSTSDAPPSNLRLFRSKNFLLMLVAYGTIFGAQCAIITLIDQLLLGPFAKDVTEHQVGMLSCAMLVCGLPGSVLVARYLDKTKRYRPVCHLLATITSLSLIGLFAAIEIHSFPGVVVACLLFGLASYAIAPAIFQYAGELFYPVQEVVPTGYLFLVGNVVGTVMVATMGLTADTAAPFSMRVPMLMLLALSLAANGCMVLVHGPLRRSMAQ
ncbi:major facilitator superfamily domain-containing protein [Gongronella butleri]|nr:major facilitator superfamily domain-containing protein [Gongronella butleri]